MYICNKCSSSSLKWSGKCPTCGEWNTLVESSEPQKKGGKSRPVGTVRGVETLVRSESYEEKQQRIESLSGELDGVLGGGLVPGSLVLLSGEPGIGKSTLALQMADWYSRKGQLTIDNGQKKEEDIKPYVSQKPLVSKNTANHPLPTADGSPVLYISGEENIHQISGRARRLEIESDIHFLTSGVFEDIVATIEYGSESVIIIDSLSVLSSDLLEGSSGSMSQLRTMVETFMLIAKRMQKSILLIGHITKDGSIGGPKALEHLVDVVLYLEGVRTENYRILRALKNRFGSTEPIGLFRMESKGLIDLSDPGLEFIDANTSDLTGSALTITMEGNRPILIEIEALTTYTKFGYPKRSARGVSQGKLELLIAVMTKFTEVKLESHDAYLNISRGLHVSEPGVDLACIAALMSSRRNTSLGRTIYLGEVSLTGVVRTVSFLDRRLSEAVKLGFTRIVIPDSYSGKIPTGVEIIRVGRVGEMEKQLNF